MNQDIIAANLAAVQVHFDAEKAGDWEKIKTMYTQDIIWERTSTKQIVKGKEEVAALVRCRFHVHIRTHQIDQPLDDGKPEACT